MLSLVALLDALNDLVDHGVDKDDEVDDDVEDDSEFEALAEMQPSCRICDIISEEEHRPDGNQDDHFIEYLDKVVSSVNHRHIDEVVAYHSG